MSIIDANPIYLKYFMVFVYSIISKKYNFVLPKRYNPNEKNNTVFVIYSS